MLLKTEILWRGERSDALCDDQFLYARGESGVEYARGPGNGGLDKYSRSTGWPFLATTHIQDDGGSGTVGEWGRDVNDGVDP